MWAAWFCINKIFFEQASPDGVSVASGFVRMVEEYHTYAKKVMFTPVLPGHASSLTSWKRPAMGSLKINTDAHVVEGVMAALGVAVRDADGRLMVTATKKIAATSPAMAEALALRFGLLIARRFGYGKLEVESDALSVINGVKWMVKGSSPICLVLDDIRHVSKSFVSFVFSHVK